MPGIEISLQLVNRDDRWVDKGGELRFRRCRTGYRQDPEAFPFLAVRSIKQYLATGFCTKETAARSQSRGSRVLPKNVKQFGCFVGLLSHCVPAIADEFNIPTPPFPHMSDVSVGLLG